MGSFVDQIAVRLGYALSLPERTVRALAGSVGGVTKVATDSLFPAPLRATVIYRVVVGDMQRFMIERLGRVTGQFPALAEGQSDAARTATVPGLIAGQAIDAAGLLAMHVSPLWVFAIAADVAAGSREYLRRLSDTLKAQGLLPTDAAPSSVEQLLTHLHGATMQSADVLQDAPVTPREAVAAARTLVQQYGDAFEDVADLMPRVDALWKRMNAVASAESLSYEKLSGLMSLDVAQTGQTAVRATWAVGAMTGRTLAETLLTGYDQTLRAIADEGMTAFLQRRLSPFFSAAWSQFDAGTPTWTERAIRWMFAERSERKTDNAP
jgi:hypothetical protein